MSLRSRVITLVITLVTSITLASCTQPASAPPAEPAMPANPLVGVWRVTAFDAPDGTRVDPAQPGLMTFTDSHFSAVGVIAPQPLARPANTFEPTDAEAGAMMRGTRAGAGTYTVDGSRMTWQFIVSVNPGVIGGTVEWEFDVAGNALTLRGQSTTDATGAHPPTAPGSVTLTRAE